MFFLEKRQGNRRGGIIEEKAAVNQSSKFSLIETWRILAKLLAAELILTRNVRNGPAHFLLPLFSSLKKKKKKPMLLATVNNFHFQRDEISRYTRKI